MSQFNGFSGEFKHDASDPGASRVNVTISTRSVEANHAGRVGNLTIHGVIRPASINLELIGEENPWGGNRSGIHGDVVLKAADYVMSYWIGDVEVELNIEGLRQ